MWFDSPGMIVGGLLAGVVFGFLLQKGQVAKYRVIIGQFLFTDYTVLKIMLTAIVVGAIGVWGMLQLGLIAHLHVKPAVLVATGIGGLIFGVGMAVLGYCPGTGVAAMGEGSHHARWGFAGMIVGAAAFAAVYPSLEKGFMKLGEVAVTTGDKVNNKVTLPDVTGVSQWVYIAVLAAISLGVFALIGKWERKQGLQ
jgi:uncharacterized membrane protein YedE/YeeE